MLGTLNISEIEELLRTQLIGRIGCHHGDSMYIVPISYAYDGEYVYCLTHEGLKLDLMRKNPRVCFEVDHMSNMANWQSVIAWGNFEELTEAPKRNQALNKLHARILPLIASETVHLSPFWPFPPEEISKIPGVAFSIRLTEKTGRFEHTHAQNFFAS